MAPVYETAAEKGVTQLGDTRSAADQKQRRWQAPMLAPVLARGIVAVVFGGFCVVAFLHLLYVAGSPASVALSAVCMLALLGLQLFYFSRPTQLLQTPVGYLALLAQASLVYLPLLQLKQAWVGMPGFLAGTVLLVLPTTLAWLAFTLVVTSMAFTQAIYTGVPEDIAYTAVSTMITGLVVYGLTRLATLVTELHEAQNELAKMAVAQERLRFARDLHDLLGYSLSAITLKSELTHRLMMKHPERAQEELAEVLDISRRALSDVRAVASGYRELSLAAESESARSVLVAADIDVHMDLDYAELPTRVRTALATVLREGVTNVLRHSKAEHCEITVRQTDGEVYIDIVNDGVPQIPLQRIGSGGSGIPNLSQRLTTLNGQLTAGLDPDGRFRLHATAPISADSPAGAR
jgi:two-component system, NarL family, sensor histidine kinase DesK